MIAFFTKCLETAMRETRVITLLADRNGVPAGSYVFHEHYCDDLRCDCRRVMIVVSKAEDEMMDNPLATITYGWESPAFYRKWSKSDDPDYCKELASANLELLTQMTVVAEGLRTLFEETLESDPQFKSRFHRHYLEFRSAVRGPVRRPPGGGRIKRR